MAADETRICNLALALLGQGAILSLEDESQAARYCARFYEQVRDEVLQAHRWNFAQREAEPPRLAEASASGWAHVYALPTDCLRVLEVNGATVVDELYEVMGRQLLTDAETVVLRYIARVTDGSSYPALFVEALAAKLGARLAQPLTGSRTLAEELLTQYERVAGPLARRVDACEGRPPRALPWEESALVRARSGGGAA